MAYRKSRGRSYGRSRNKKRGRTKSKSTYFVSRLGTRM